MENNIKALKKVEELKNNLSDDSRAIQILDRIYKENREGFRWHVCGVTIFVIGITLLIFCIIAGKGNVDDSIIYTLFAICLLLLVISFFISNSCLKTKVSDDELTFLNAVLKERTMSSLGKYPIIQKGDQSFIDENGTLKYIGKVENQTMTECEKFSYKKVEDWEDLLVLRYQVLTCSEVRY